MVDRVASRIEERLADRTNGGLRSIVAYGRGEFDVVYLRDDVAAKYTEDEFADAIDGSRLDSLYAPVYEGTFADDHGDLVCMVQAFENVVEMNVALDDGAASRSRWTGTRPTTSTLSSRTSARSPSRNASDRNARRRPRFESAQGESSPRYSLQRSANRARLTSAPESRLTNSPV